MKMSWIISEIYDHDWFWRSISRTPNTQTVPFFVRKTKHYLFSAEIKHYLFFSSKKLNFFSSKKLNFFWSKKLNFFSKKKLVQHLSKEIAEVDVPRSIASCCHSGDNWLIITDEDDWIVEESLIVSSSDCYLDLFLIWQTQPIYK